MEHYHFIGIGGIGMSALAQLLLARGASVSGSDIAYTPLVKKLESLGAIIYRGHAQENIPPLGTIIYSSDIKEDNPEFKRAKEGGYLLLHRAALLARFVEVKKGLAVAGTHGKTTTSSLLATVLLHALPDSSFVVGGILSNFNTHAQWGNGEYLVFEADESDQSFLRYHAYGAILTNIDDDHLSNYEGKRELLIKAFQDFSKQVTSPAHLFYWCEDPFLSALSLGGQSYGYAPQADWRIVFSIQKGFQSLFDLRRGERLYSSIEIPLSGRHNVLNAAAVFGLALSLGIDEEKIREAFILFKGVGRRSEWKGKIGSIDLLDDYAHHPTEIKTTLQAIKQAIGDRRLIAVFQPHRYTRIEESLGRFSGVFDSASHVVLTDIYGAGEKPIPGLSSQNLEGEIGRPFTFVKRDEIARFLADFAIENDFVVTLGAGDITKVAEEWIALHQRGH